MGDGYCRMFDSRLLTDLRLWQSCLLFVLMQRSVFDLCQRNVVIGDIMILKKGRAKKRHATTVNPDGGAVFAARGANDWSQEFLHEKSKVSLSKIHAIERGEPTSRTIIERVAHILDVPVDTLILPPADNADSTDAIRWEIERFLNRNEIRLNFWGQFIEVFSSPECRGWKRSEVSHIYRGDYSSPPELDKLMALFVPKPPIREYFSLHKCPAFPFADDLTSLVFELAGGTWHHVSALSKIFEFRHSDPACKKFRKDFEDRWIQDSETGFLESSPLYHNVNAETLVLTADLPARLILGKRHEDMLYGGTWSATLEEQMLRRDPDKPRRKDKHLFDAAERGVREELGITVISDETRLLKVGIEWGNFTAAFLFVVRCSETYDEVVERWKKVKHDPYEAIALAYIRASPGVIDRLDEKSYRPPPGYAKRVAVKKPQADWHPTALARLRALRDHLAYHRAD
jgi:transcriptional regulator with XRE-family HTH domain